MDIYTACAVQSVIKLAQTRADIKQNIKRCLELIECCPEVSTTATIDYASANWAPVKLVCFPEFTFQGYDVRWSLEHLMNTVVVDIPGEETDRFAQKAKEYQIYITMCALEKDPDIKGRYWNTQFIIDPRGEIIHKYHKFTPAAQWELAISPHDIYDAYVAKHGDSLSAFFPVTETEIGKIGTTTCMDGNFPEQARALGIQGAEIITHPNAPDPMASPPLEIWQATNKMRAWENCTYYICPNWGRLEGTLRPEHIVPGKSMIVKYDGSVLAYADYPGETIISAVINLEELRRRKTSMSRNFLLSLRTEVYRKIYEQPIYPVNRYLGKGPTSRAERNPRDVLKDLYRKGIFIKPKEMPGYLK